MLFDHKNATVWQSFDHPTDTIVPGQTLVEGMRLTSNASATNTTENQFSIMVLPKGYMLMLNPDHHKSTLNIPLPVKVKEKTT